MMNQLAEFHFIRPYWLLALILVAIISYLIVKNKLQQGQWSSYCDAELLPFILQQKATQNSRWMLTTGVLSCILAIIALAGPTWERLPSPVFRNDAALVIALDLSRSMDATDIKPSRLIKARYKIADILNDRKDGQTALIVYAGDAFIVTPLTNDTETIKSQLSALKTEIMPGQGSDTILALEQASSLLKQAGIQSGDILLVTDHVDYDNTYKKIQSLAGYRLSILGVGTAEGAPIKISEGGGFVKDSQGNIVIPKLQASKLSKSTRLGNGYYRTISSDDGDIDALKNYFNNPIEKENNKDDNLFIDQWVEVGPWLILLIIPFAALQFRKGILSLLFVCLLPFPKSSYAMEWKDLWQTQDQQARQQFDQKNYPQAAEQFTDPSWKAAAQYQAGQFEQAAETLQDEQSAIGLYNRGNALAKAGDLPAALKAYNQSLVKEPDNKDAQFNKEAVQKVLEEQEKQQQDNKEGDDQQDSQEDKENQDKDKQNKDSEQSDQKESQDSESKQEDSQPEQQSEDNSKSDEQKSKEAQQNEEEKAEENADKAEQEKESLESFDESKQATEQWLKRIPDDPAGLLRRKFKYQYGQRERKGTQNESW